MLFLVSGKTLTKIKNTHQNQKHSPKPKTLTKTKNTHQNQKLCPTKICERFHTHCSPYNLRVTEFAILRFRTNKYGKHSLTYLGPKLWNKLPSETRSLPSLFSFKSRISKFDLSAMVEDDNCFNCIVCNS